jgi:sRNA-binding carbon storage regulator CsrA
MLYIDLKVNEVLRIGDVTVSLVRKSGQLARLSIDADKSKEVKKITRGISLQVRENDIIQPE